MSENGAKSVQSGEKWGRKIRFLCLFAAGIFLLNSCSELRNETPLTLYGLPHVAIEMRESDYRDLLKNALVNEYAAITIERDGRKLHGQIRRRGHSSRYFPKPSFKIRTDCGENLNFIASNIDKSYLREVFSNIIFESFGFIVPKNEFVAISINNVYQGLYFTREQIDEKFFERRNIEVNSLYAMRNYGRFTFENGYNSQMSFEKIIPQSSTNYNDLNILISALDENEHKNITGFLDVENAANYSFISSAINNDDGITKNLHIVNTKPSNKFEIIPYDLDLTFGQTMTEGVVIPKRLPKFENGLLERAEEIFLRGREREPFLRIFSYCDLYVLDSLKSEISQAYKNDPYLRGENLDEHIEKIKNYIFMLY